jgi:hypothetical protein
MSLEIFIKTVLKEKFVSFKVAFSAEMCFFKVKALQGQT